MAAYNRQFTFANHTGGSGDKDTLPESLANNEHMLVAVWDYSTTPGTGNLVYLKDGSATEVNLQLLRPYTRAGNSDRAAFFLFRGNSSSAGSYVLRTKNLPYACISAIIFTAKPNFWVKTTTNDLGAGEGTATGLNLVSPSLAPDYADPALALNAPPALAFGLMTHNIDGSAVPSDSALDADTAGGWTLVHKQEDYDGASQPGATQYKSLTSTSAITSRFQIAVATVAYLSQLAIVVDPPEVYRLMGGTQGTGWFGNDNAGGADSSDTLVHPTFVPVNQLVVYGSSLYNHTPTAAELISDDGSNAWVKRTGVAHNDLGAHNDGSWTFYDSLLSSPLTSITINTSSVLGDNAKWGQAMAWVIENPDTVNGYATAIPIIRSQTDATVIDPTNGGSNPLLPPTTLGLALWGITNRGHTEDFLPIVISDARFSELLHHTQLHVITNLGSTPPVYGSFHNSYTQSGSGLGAVISDGLPISPTIDFNGPVGLSARTHSVLMFYNILGGTPVGGGGGGGLGDIFHGTVFGRRAIRRAA